MMGERTTEQPALFYGFSLERHVPADHLLRSIDRFVDLTGIREHLRPYYSETGRPSIDPELMIRMLLIGYTHGIRSERRLCEEVHLNLAYRWFCRLGLDGAVPDHSTFSKNRHGRFRDSGLLRKLFQDTVARCIAAGLVGGEAFAVDASMIKADANRQRSTPGADWRPPDDPGRAVREYLSVLDDTAFGAATSVTPKFVSTADPASRWTGANGGLAFFAYSDNYLIDLQHAVIVDVEATTSVRQAEVGAGRTMLDRTRERFGLKPQRLAADAGYGDAANLAWLVEERGIEPHIPVFEKDRTDGSFGRADFGYSHETDSYTCPGGRELRRYWQDSREAKARPPADGIYRYRARKAECDACSLRSRCRPGEAGRKLLRSIHEDARDVARKIALTDAYLISRRERKKVEMLFAHLKRILRLDRLRLKGPNGARDEFILAAAAQNLRKLAKLIPMPALATA
jgi:transposase